MQWLQVVEDGAKSIASEFSRDGPDPDQIWLGGICWVDSAQGMRALHDLLLMPSSVTQLYHLFVVECFSSKQCADAKEPWSAT